MRSDDLDERREAEYGYRDVSGKQLRLTQWAEQRDDRVFAALVNRLRVRKWQKEVYAEGGARLERLRENARRWWRKQWAEKPEKWRAYHKARRRKAYTAAPIECACIECGATWCKVPWVRGVRPRFCGDRCYQRHQYRTNESYRESMKANARNQHARRLAAAQEVV
jgi:hypothetical protein